MPQGPNPLPVSSDAFVVHVTKRREAAMDMENDFVNIV